MLIDSFFEMAKASDLNAAPGKRQSCSGQGAVALAEHLSGLSPRSSLREARQGDDQSGAWGWEKPRQLFPCRGPTPGGAVQAAAEPCSTGCRHRGAPLPQTNRPRHCLSCHPGSCIPHPCRLRAAVEDLTPCCLGSAYQQQPSDLSAIKQLHSPFSFCRGLEALRLLLA